MALKWIQYKQKFSKKFAEDKGVDYKEFLFGKDAKFALLRKEFSAEYKAQSGTPSSTSSSGSSSGLEKESPEVLGDLEMEKKGKIGKKGRRMTMKNQSKGKSNLGKIAEQLRNIAAQLEEIM